MRILVVDDNEDSRVFLERALRSRKHDVVSTGNGADALDRACQCLPELVISDILMPEMNGFELCRRMKTDDRLRNIPFIFYTATFVDQGDEKLAMQLGASRFLVKPMENDELLEIVNEVVEERSANQLSAPDRPFAELEEICQMQTEALQRKLDKKVRDLAKEHEALQLREEQLRWMASEISFVEERERHKIATALHDQIGQPLAMAGIKLMALRKADIPGDLGRQIDEILDMINHAIRHSRTLTFELSPPILYDMGLEAAVCSLAERYQKEHGIRIDCCDDRRPKPLSDDMRVLLFQGVRELLVNAVKHAHARRIAITCHREGTDIRIMVKDDGVGFTTAEGVTMTGKNYGFGLFSLRERLKYLGGSIAIKSAPGSGTQVTLTAPLAVEPEVEGGTA